MLFRKQFLLKKLKCFLKIKKNIIKKSIQNKNFYFYKKSCVAFKDKEKITIKKSFLYIFLFYK